MSDDPGDPIESVIRGLRSERLFFEPELSCSLVLHHQNPNPNPNPKMVEDNGNNNVVYKESEALSMDSNNPCEDFRRSMEEMVEAHGLKDWNGLEELLGCYLKINDKINHSYIIGAFIDLLVHHFSFNNNNNNNSPSTSTSTSTCISSSSNNNNLNCSLSTPSSPFSLPSSSLTTPCLSSSLDHDDDANNDEHGGEKVVADPRFRI